MQVTSSRRWMWTSPTFGKGQTLALIDDGCKLSMPEWSQPGSQVPKVVVSYDSIIRSITSRQSIWHRLMIWSTENQFHGH